MTDPTEGAREIKKIVAEHWGRRAPTFDEAPTHGIHGDEQRAAWLSLLGRLTGPTPLDVLDLGCGTGFLALLLAHLGHRVTGIDLSPEMIAIATDKARALGLEASFRVG